MDDKEKVELLVRVLNRMRSQYEALIALGEEFDRQADDRLLQQWGQRWERGRWERRLLEARN